MITPGRGIGMGHLGSRVSALLDGQLSAEESERAWAHVHACHTCRDQVEREGWLKRRLAGLAFDVAAPAAPADLKGSLLGVGPDGPGGQHPTAYSLAPAPPRHRAVGLAALGGGAVGAAVVGALVLGTGPADAPGLDRTPPVTSISRTPVTPVHTQTDAPRGPGAGARSATGPTRRSVQREAAHAPVLTPAAVPAALRTWISPDAPR